MGDRAPAWELFYTVLCPGNTRGYAIWNKNRTKGGQFELKIHGRIRMAPICATLVPGISPETKALMVFIHMWLEPPTTPPVPAVGGLCPGSGEAVCPDLIPQHIHLTCQGSHLITPVTLTSKLSGRGTFKLSSHLTPHQTLVPAPGHNFQLKENLTGKRTWKWVGGKISTNINL